MQAVAIDFETANESRTSACSIGVAWIEDGRVVETEEHLIRPREMRFNPFNTAVHGLRAEDVAGAPEFPEVWHRFARRLEGRLVLAHNASFDISVLRHTLDDYGLAWPACSYLCTVVLARKAWPQLAAHKLNYLADHLGIALDHHRAGSDAEACGRIALAATHVLGLERLADIAAATGITLGQLTPGGYSPCKGGNPPRRRKLVPVV
ncbi:exonuclease [Azospirillum brasilense]|uniref:Exonuclease n=1 Tax=Azospirillum brasilense TaxID=192 RepID=A0A0P0EPH7_AZOBR|nr:MULTISPECIES: 3'-5' exonuclease [Azospirillum]ALJ36217.1 exonuclease [Azospirillum brasilense]MDW7552662.1 3'-5' exonuclease [Azospirillum brasilense]MDW7592146.1 3'-5' exonuclease [Azospirillum brasilense]MDW7627277.1 3'-5' exonuclease [Azospirillum brasilense]MDX5955034.1 3'-5' exonuclease [Azospirillum brasilense]